MHSPDSTKRSPWIWLGVGLLAALPSAAVVLAATLDLLTWEAWVHESAGHFDWTPFIHPPLYNEVLWLGEQLAEATGVRAAVGVSWLGALTTGAIAAGVAAFLSRSAGLRWGLFAAALVALSAAGMRPFEQYPLSRITLTAAVLGTLLLVDPRTRRVGGLAVATALVAALSTELHLNAWVVLAPLWAVLLLGGRRRALGIIFAAVAAVFLASTALGLAQVLADGPMNEPGWTPPMSWDRVTFERNNPFLLLPLLLWLLPSVRRPRGLVALALPTVVLVYIAATTAQQYSGLGIGGTFANCHHYYELIDPLMALAATWALADAWAATAPAGGSGHQGGSGHRKLVLAFAGALLVSQIVWLARSCQASSAARWWQWVDGTTWI